MRTVPFMRRLAAATATVAATLTAVSCVAAVNSGAASASGTYVNPLAGHPWGIYTGGSDGLYPAYEQASGTAKKMLAREALTPHTRWYTSYIPASDVADKISSEIATEQHGNPNVMVWMATFALWPYHESALKQPLTQADQANYKKWVNNAALGIGNSRVALIVEPDLPVSTNGWRPAVRLSLVRYAVKKFTALPNATVYLDAGSADWLRLPREIPMLEAAGIQYVHGFSLGATHHTRVVHEIRYGRAVAMALAKAGYGRKHFIIDTSDNGHGYAWGEFWAAHPNGDYNDPPACTTMTEKACVSLGIPPTTDVTNPKWGLPASLQQTLHRRCDAFVWIARPWLADNGRFFNQQKAVNVARTDPYLG